ncbi:hypothetical protein M5689_006103 [Euphorbia peplus]|nr:hypothetical protein M5689_006103 [Euphorbia peplus]
MATEASFLFLQGVNSACQWTFMVKSKPQPCPLKIRRENLHLLGMSNSNAPNSQSILIFSPDGPGEIWWCYDHYHMDVFELHPRHCIGEIWGRPDCRWGAIARAQFEDTRGKRISVS